MSNPRFLEREVQGQVALRSVNPSVYERILHTFNLMSRLVYVLERIMANSTPHMISNVDVVSRRKGRVTAQPWTDRSLDIEFPAPGGQEYLNLHFSDNISDVITHHQVANIVADLTDLMSFINPNIWQHLSDVDRHRVILLAIPQSLIDEVGLDGPGALTLSAKAAPRNRPRRRGLP
ncbi:hypothetical protein NCS57_00416600 [Fusarium keratoplasticum]|uniref:Uncharacterized protein n=1 Tax=Fusarium keratoplasticum TaxID=1328300 RepID=A0ACC0R4M0_9HYPO|nr:hypothetical protein NCS57_00416600 [Fusarium keratoplasticum]KAI8675164.1 hypothetical protein NCS57_00416600 [Fusarium keratoplasticum]